MAESSKAIDAILDVAESRADLVDDLQETYDSLLAASPDHQWEEYLYLPNKLTSPPSRLLNALDVAGCEDYPDCDNALEAVLEWGTAHLVWVAQVDAVNEKLHDLSAFLLLAQPDDNDPLLMHHLARVNGAWEDVAVAVVSIDTTESTADSQIDACSRVVPF